MGYSQLSERTSKVVGKKPLLSPPLPLHLSVKANEGVLSLNVWSFCKQVKIP